MSEKQISATTCYKCECGKRITREYKKQHERTQIHIKFIQTGERPLSTTTKYRCDCGGHFWSETKKQHERSQIHIKFLNK